MGVDVEPFVVLVVPDGFPALLGISNGAQMHAGWHLLTSGTFGGGGPGGGAKSAILRML